MAETKRSQEQAVPSLAQDEGERKLGMEGEGYFERKREKLQD